ncbi:hypothetical protein BVC80_8219g4 [Macleaya cordata]|uniref:Retrotransposon gag domain-containing protein n=1 Tax=Macleaya cordata TaxID=56857 RepID=A0A200QJA5_MACCD|nr:hypothetical protein BVC80_8219g4 [Macleaya cordata]
MNNDVHIGVPNFEGKLDPDKFLDWIDNIEKVFGYKNLTGIKCIHLVATKLRGYAQIWWSDCVKQRELIGK